MQWPMVSVVDWGGRGKGGHHIVFLGNTLYSHSTSLHPDINLD